jgi:hypothetical protein
LEYIGEVLYKTIHEDLLKAKKVPIGKEKRRLQVISNRFVNAGPGAYDTSKVLNKSPLYSIGKVRLGAIR